jgi:methionyl aminopeptidase
MLSALQQTPGSPYGPTLTDPKESGIDARISELSASMQEVMESYEVVVDNATVPVKAVRNITGHNILRYRIHGAKQVPFVRTKTPQRMDEGDVFAIETFGSTGRGVLRDADGVYGYGRAEGVSVTRVRSPSAKALLRTIEENFGTLVFAKRYVERLPGVKNMDLGMRDLVREGVVDVYKPLVDVKGSYIAQFEHVSRVSGTLGCCANGK